MRNRIPLFFVLFAPIISGYRNTALEITESEIESIVEKHHKNHYGTVEILSIEHRNTHYVVKWEIEENCEWGTDKVDDENGKMEMVEAAIC